MHVGAVSCLHSLTDCANISLERSTSWNRIFDLADLERLPPCYSIKLVLLVIWQEYYENITKIGSICLLYCL